MMPSLFTYCFDSKINYTGKYIATPNMIDIFISNHISTVDFLIYLSIIRIFDQRDIHFIYKDNVKYIPGGGFILASSNDIPIRKNLETDKENIINNIKHIKEGIIVIMPEGTRYTPEKMSNAQQYSKDNNLPVFNNTLFPKMKGLYTIINTLKDMNKLGNIIDFTTVIQNFKNKPAYLHNLLMKNTGDTFTVIKSYSIPLKHTNDYDDFKKWFLKIWKRKDETLSCMNKYSYDELIPNIKSHNYMFIIIIITLYLYLITHCHYIYVPCTLLLSYILIIINKK
jgi:1-acyl-sn-glycerol-3-phosphate acyltransferase